jgi:VanZ family protein
VIDEHRNAAQPTTPTPSSIVYSRWAINLGYAILLIVMAVIPPASSEVVASVPDWLVHAAAYGAQAGLLFWAMLPVVGLRRALVSGILGAGLFGAATETLQMLQPARTVEVRDVVANSVGAIVVGLTIAIMARSGSGRNR